MALTFYRIVLTDPPTLTDFLSNSELGRFPKNPDPETLRLWQGISAYDTEERARATAKKYRRLGRFIVELRIAEDGSIQYERTTSSHGHYTLWGDPALLLACVTRLVPV